jgi:hypothetical protein
MLCKGVWRYVAGGLGFAALTWKPHEVESKTSDMPFDLLLWGKGDEIAFMTLHQMDLLAALGYPVASRTPSSETHESGGSCKRRMAFTAEEMRHHFAIETLDRPGAFRSQPYLYTCVRCKWIFRINDSRGSIVALDGLGRRLAEPENAKRIVTFHRGPCPAFRVFEYLAPETADDLPANSRLTGYLSRFVDALLSLTSSRRRSRSRTHQTTLS